MLELAKQGTVIEKESKSLIFIPSMTFPCETTVFIPSKVKVKSRMAKHPLDFIVSVSRLEQSSAPS